jgi:putative hydrolase of the HAD superfamily
MNVGKQPTIIWDFEGTLAECPGLWRGALMQVLDEKIPGHQIDQEQIRPFLRDGFFWHKADQCHTQIKTADDWWSSLEPLFARAYCGVGFRADLAQKLAGLVRNCYINPARFSLYEDTITVLKALKLNGWKHVILTNHVPELESIVLALGLGDYIDRVFSSAVTGYEKPNPGAYRIALDYIGHTDDVWMVGDNLESDIKGSEAVGIPAILVHRETTETVRYYAQDLSTAVKIILGCNTLK